MALRSAMHHAGGVALSQLLQFSAPPAEARRVGCGCGQQAVYRELRSKSLLTAVGKAQLRRPYYLCPHCHKGQFPVDAELDIAGTEFSPAVRRMQATVGLQMPFEAARRQMKLLAGIELTAKSVERTAEAIGEDIGAREQRAIQRAVQLDLPIVIGKPVPTLYIEMDGTGVPVVKKETLGRKGKTAGQAAHTREVKLGCVFTQSGCDQEGYAIRDADSTTYVAAIENAEDFGKRLYVEVWNRGWSRADKKVVIGDGAEWIWNLANQHFPGAVQIVDLFHARQHLWDLARRLHPNDEAGQQHWILVHQNLLDNGKLKKLTVALCSIPTDNAELAEKLRTEADYFHRNALRMRYPKFRRQHLFVGSGVIEAACKTIVASRLKQSGMFWTVKGANDILTLRCCDLNGRFEDYWEDRHAA